MTNDAEGTARKVVMQAYEFVLSNIGMDPQSGKIWQDYIQFIRSSPGTVGGSSWQDQHKMDQLRKAFHRAIAVPTPAIITLWREYEQFESSLSKATVRFLTAPSFSSLGMKVLILAARLGSLRQNGTRPT
jgi:cleavage stimulation factor subunit 3